VSAARPVEMVGAFGTTTADAFLGVREFIDRTHRTPLGHVRVQQLHHAVLPDGTSLIERNAGPAYRATVRTVRT
jgi:hypothetical protein